MDIGNYRGWQQLLRSYVPAGPLLPLVGRESPDQDLLFSRSALDTAIEDTAIMLSDYITPTLITLCILLVTWYFLGIWLNRRRGIHLARSLHDRLNALGAEELTGRWVNPS